MHGGGTVRPLSPSFAGAKLRCTVGDRAGCRRKGRVASRSPREEERGATTTTKHQTCLARAVPVGDGGGTVTVVHTGAAGFEDGRYLINHGRDGWVAEKAVKETSCCGWTASVDVIAITTTAVTIAVLSIVVIAVVRCCLRIECGCWQEARR